MKLMHSLKHELSLFAAATVFAAICALAWGSPFVGYSSNSGGAIASSSAPQGLRSQIFRGTVINRGAQILLRDSSGQTFRLANSALAQAYLGKTVTVTGRIDAAKKLIELQHIDSHGV